MKLYVLAYLKKDILIVTIQFAYTTFAGTEDTQVYKMHPGTVNFMCKLGWAKGCPDSQSNIISGCTCEGVCRRNSHLNQ